MKILDYAVAKKLGIAFSGGAHSLAEKAIAQKLGGGSGGNDDGGVDWSKYTYALYNGVKLPKLPEDVRKNYPYIYMWRYNNNYYFRGATAKTYLYNNNSLCTPESTYITGKAVGDSWEVYEPATGSITIGFFAFWANYDMPKGSADSTDIYSEGSDPVPTD